MRAFFLALLLVAAPLSGAKADIIISQYYEGASNDKYLELFNTGATDVDLAAGVFKLSVFSNANREIWKTSGTPNSTITLSGVIAAGSTYLIRNSSAVSPPYAVSGANQSTGSLSHNGDDSLVLWSGAAYSFANVVDAFGVTGSGFADTSYVRNTNIVTGTNQDFAAADWTQYILDDVANAAPGTVQRLGFHEINSVPEPNTLGLLVISGVVFLIRRRA